MSAGKKTGDFDTVYAGTTSRRIRNVTGSGSMRAVFAMTQHTINVIPSANGTLISPSGGSATVNQGSSLVIEVQPKQDYVFVNWSDPDDILTTTQESQMLVTINPVTKPGTVTANFAHRPWSITVSSNPQAGGSTSPTTVSWQYGGQSPVTLTASPTNPDYEIVSWSADSWITLSSYGKTLTTQITAATQDGAVVANFAKKVFRVIVSASSNGSIQQPSIGYTDVVYGGSQTIIAAANAHYHFTSWSNPDGLTITSPNNASTSITNVIKGGTVTANFAIDQHDVSFYVNGNGTISPPYSAGSTHSLPWDSPIAGVTANASTGNAFTSWTLSGGVALANGYLATSNPVNLKITGNNGQVTANFAINQYTVDVLVNDNNYGSVIPVSQIVNHGGYFIVTYDTSFGCSYGSASTGDGYTIARESSNSIRISNVQKTGSVQVNFSEIDPTPNVICVSASGEAPSAQKDGSTWYRAYTSLAKAMNDKGAGTTFWVAKGVYTPVDELGTPNDRAKYFTIQDGDYVLGGFEGNEIDLNARANKWQKFIAELSGDIGTQGVNTDNSNNVLYMPAAANGGGNSKLEAVVVSNCNNGSNSGHGLMVLGTNNRVVNCIFRDNIGYGVEIRGNTNTITSSAFINNSGFCGLLVYSGLTGIKVESSMFCNNNAPSGAIVSNSAGVIYVNCTIFNNRSSNNAAGGLHNVTGDIITNCIFWGNSSSFTGRETMQINVASSIMSSCIQYLSTTGIGTKNTNWDKGGNIQSDPLFVNTSNIYGPSDNILFTSDDGLMLQKTPQYPSNSPCIAAGNGSQTYLPTVDIRSETRFINGIDIGAYEQ